MKTSWDALFLDMRFAWRALARDRRFSFMALAMLAVGIGFSAAAFAVMNAILFRGFRSVERNDRILYIDTQRYGGGCCVSYPDFENWRDEARSFEGLAAVADEPVTLVDDIGLADSAHATRLSASSFRLLRQSPILGRDFAGSDEQAGAPPVAILSYRLWTQRYSRDPGIVGHLIRINNTSTAVIGVMPNGFSFPQNQDLWIPFTATARLQDRGTRDSHIWFVFGRLIDGVTARSARSELQGIGRRLAASYPATNDGVAPVVKTFMEFHVGTNALATYAGIWFAVQLVLLIICTNLGNLALGRAIGRSHEISIRLALGARRWRVVQQFLIEGFLLSGGGAILGWWIARLLLKGYLGESSTSVLDVAMDRTVLLYSILLTGGTALVFELAPVLRLLQVDVNRTLKTAGRGMASQASGRWSNALMTAEVALAVILLCAAGLVLRSLYKVATADLGVQTANVFTMSLRLGGARYPGAQAQSLFFDQVQRRLSALPGVQSVALTRNLPIAPTLKLPFEIAGSPTGDPKNRPAVGALVIGPSYFRVLGAQLMMGREFASTDNGSTLQVAIVNRRFASEHWPGASALGEHIRLFNGSVPGSWLTVVGVVSNIVQSDFTRQRFDPLVYVPYGQNPRDAMYVIARTAVDPAKLVPAFRNEVRLLDPDLVGANMKSMDEFLADFGSYPQNRSYGILLATFAGAALLLAAFGLYAVVSQYLIQRTQEIGVRIALGASRRDIFRVAALNGFSPLIVGLIIGTAASVAINPLLKFALVKVSPNDPVTFIVVAVTLCFFGALGCWIPALRASRVDPIIALRLE